MFPFTNRLVMHALQIGVWGSNASFGRRRTTRRPSAKQPYFFLCGNSGR